MGASCDGGRKPAAEPGSESAEPVAGERVDELPQVDVSELTDAEQEVFVELINSQLSPCGDPVSVGRCVVDQHKCGSCLTAARYLSRLVMEGHEREVISEHYKGRFDPGKAAEPKLGDSPSRGASMARVTIVEFSDFECPYCGLAHPQLARVLREFEGRVRMVFKHYPLSGHPHALPAAKAAEAARLQGKFWEMHDLLFEHQRELDDAALERYAQQLGLDLERFRADLASEAVKARIEADRAEGKRLGVDSTPSIFINGRRFREAPKNLAAYMREETEL